MALAFNPVYPTLAGLPAGRIFNFARIGAVAGEGWAAAADWGRWSVGPRATLTIPSLAEQPVGIQFDVRAYLTGSKQALVVAVLVNGQQRSSWRFAGDDNRRVRELILSSADTADGAARAELLIDSPTSPFLQGKSEDRRLLGVGLYGIGWRAVPP